MLSREEFVNFCLKYRDLTSMLESKNRELKAAEIDHDGYQAPYEDVVERLLGGLELPTAEHHECGRQWRLARERVENLAAEVKKLDSEREEVGERISRFDGPHRPQAGGVF